LSEKKFLLQQALSAGQIHYFFETNLAKNISPSPKGLMGFILFGGAIFLFGGLSPPKPMPGYVPGE